ncbi:HdeD family acid-resistance protein [Roseomonas gilardii]|uniref:HdeD family acid-resistance protein n=1 Tax=Roseomonas gilardii TaxID=257708 RepID=UPI0021B55548|nr:hypothetical protein [Roseomonas gilardii]
MIRLAFLLLGARALRRQWPLLAAAGATWMTLGVLILIDLSDRHLIVLTDTLGILLGIKGFVEAGSALVLGLRRNWLLLVRGLGLMLTGFLVADIPWDNNIGSTLLFGTAFLLDGLFRIASAFYVHATTRWRFGILAGLTEIGLSILVFTDWPIPHHLTVPFCLSMLLLSSGWSLLVMSLQLRRLSPTASVTTLPLYAARNWHARGQVHPEHAEPVLAPSDALLRVHAWTPLSSAEQPRRRPLLDRYIAAEDHKGVVSTGHMALELPPELYISHYPALEIDRDPANFLRTLNAGPHNDVPGRFLPSHAEEVADWCPPDSGVTFHRFNAAALRTFWATYARDNTYNLTARNCSSAVVLALDAAIEGALARGNPWLSFARLLADPNFWMMRLVRGRAELMTWTPGLALDYARLLQQVTEDGDRGWRRRLRAALRAPACLHRAASPGAPGRTLKQVAAVAATHKQNS